MTMHRLRRLSAAAALFAAALLASCESPTGGGAGALARMDVVAGDLQTGTAGAELPQALGVRVLDDRGHPVRGQIVRIRDRVADLRATAAAAPGARVRCGHGCRAGWAPWRPAAGPRPGR